jgi:NADP-dependent 3-hydroxy acid dehydrogenase YdfG
MTTTQRATENNRTALITGASRGIGYELTRLFASDGYDVVLVARSQDRLEQIGTELEDAHGITATVVAKDLAVRGAAEKLFETIDSAGVRVHTLVNNAGTASYGHFCETDPERDRAMLQLNLVTATELTKLFARRMCERGNGQILNVSSLAGVYPIPKATIYAATKSYLLSFSVALANELATIAADYDIDSREAIELANKHPRVEILQPGPGVGGHCLPIDPWFLGHGSDRLDLIETARGVNDGMSEYVTGVLAEELGELAEKKIAILGAAYKGNVDDTRMSPGLKLARELRYAGPEQPPEAVADGGAVGRPEVAIHDPHVTDPTLDLSDLETATADADAVVIATDHDEFEDLEPAALRERMEPPNPFVFDTKGILDPEAWRTAEFRFRRL